MQRNVLLDGPPLARGRQQMTVVPAKAGTHGTAECFVRWAAACAGGRSCSGACCAMGRRLRGGPIMQRNMLLDGSPLSRGRQQVMCIMRGLTMLPEGAPRLD